MSENNEFIIDYNMLMGYCGNGGDVIDLINKKEALEKYCYVEWVDIDSVSALLPLPYHKKALEYYMKKYSC